MEVADDSTHATHVVGVCVADGDRIETRDSALPEVGRNDIFTNIEVGLSVAEMPSGVEQYGSIVRSDDEKGVALTNIDGCDLKNAGQRWSGRKSGNHDGASDEKDETEGREQPVSARENDCSEESGSS